MKHLQNCTFYTNNWDAFADILPPESHIIGKSETHMIECDNSNTRHHLAWFTRCTKVVSKSLFMVDLSIGLECALIQPDIFKQWQEKMMCIFE